MTLTHHMFWTSTSHLLNHSSHKRFVQPHMPSTYAYNICRSGEGVVKVVAILIINPFIRTYIKKLFR
ncbi:hypothetical protein EmuJ_000722100 [Echinococcus multilocularis]|uniref:Uncharacterized protein n=1 Tax=Echinococcus multilocularis TaxID=6211 RepID=A0A068YBI9_ECHMU|nr:hypothetical protein EmuJ_000722100 [Echinococcus multilocularis]